MRDTAHLSAQALALDAASEANPRAFGLTLDVSEHVETANRYADEVEEAAREMDPPEPVGPQYDADDVRREEDIDVAEISSDS